MFFLRLCFHDGHLYSKCLFNILTIYHKFHIIHFLAVAYVHNFYPNKGSKWMHRSSKRECFLLKNVPFEGSFLDEGHLYANCLFYIVSIYRKCFLFQFLCCAIHMHIPILREVQNGRISHQKNSHNLLNMCTF